jgi:multiple antibiotic resistance protein
MLKDLRFVKDLLFVFGALFPVMNPIGGASIFLAFTRQYPQVVRRMLARKVAFYSLVILAVSLFFGSEILLFFGISIGVIQIAGGLVLAVSGWDLLIQKGNESADRALPAQSEHALEHAFFPLTLPITVGPGTISIAITLGTQYKPVNQPGLVGVLTGPFVAALMGMFLLCSLVLVSYWNADRLARKLGKTGTTIFTRLSALILFAIGVQIIWNGIKTGLPEIVPIFNGR